MKKNILSVFIVIITVMFVLLLSTLTITNSKFIYSLSIEKLNLEARGGISKEEIKSNYSYIVDYILSKDKSEEFHLPTLEYSEDGAEHFLEVRRLFDLAKIVSLGLLLGIILFMGIYYFNFKNWRPIKYSGWSLILMPISTTLIVSVNFNFFFTVFHKIFFNNDKWLFDPITDPIIYVLPEEFFALCAGLIVLLAMIIGVILLLGYKGFLSDKKKEKSERISVIN